MKTFNLTMQIISVDNDITEEKMLELFDQFVDRVGPDLEVILFSNAVLTNLIVEEVKDEKQAT